MRLFGFGKKKVEAPVRTATAIDRPARLGDRVRDVVSGYEGVVMSYGTHLHGCDRLSVESDKLTEGGKPNESHAFDIMRLEVLEEYVLPSMPVEAGYDHYLPGAEVKDRLTGYTGIIGVRETMVTGDLWFGVEPRTLNKDGDIQKSAFFPAGRLEFVKAKEPPVAEGARELRQPGGPVTRGFRRN